MDGCTSGGESTCSRSSGEEKPIAPSPVAPPDRTPPDFSAGTATNPGVSSDFSAAALAGNAVGAEGLFRVGSCGGSMEKLESGSSVSETGRYTPRSRRRKGSHKTRKVKTAAGALAGGADNKKKKGNGNSKTPRRPSRRRSCKRKKRPTSNSPSVCGASVRSSGTALEGEGDSSNGEPIVQLPRPFNAPKGPPAAVHVVSHSLAEMQGGKKDDSAQSLSRSFEIFNRIISRPDNSRITEGGVSMTSSQDNVLTSMSTLKDSERMSGSAADRVNPVVAAATCSPTAAFPFSPPAYGRSGRRQHSPRTGGGHMYSSTLTFSSLLSSFSREQSSVEKPPAKPPSAIGSTIRHSLTDLLEGKVPRSADSTPQPLLSRTLSTPAEKERTATIVFDLDETLCNNRVNGPAILRPGAVDMLRRLRACYPRAHMQGTSTQGSCANNIEGSDSRTGLGTANSAVSNSQLLQLEIVLWTASVESVARPVVSRLDPDGAVFDCVICRDSRWYDESGYTKDLRLLGRYIERSVIVENSPLCVKLNRRNAILVSDFVRNRMDRQLYVVCAILMEWLENVNALLARQRTMRANMERRRNCELQDGGESPEPEMVSSEAPGRGSRPPGLTRGQKADLPPSALSLHELERRASAIYFVGGHPFISPATRFVKSSFYQQAMRFLCGEIISFGRGKNSSRRRPASKQAVGGLSTPKGKYHSLASLPNSSVTGRSSPRGESTS